MIVQIKIFFFILNIYIMVIDYKKKYLKYKNKYLEAKKLYGGSDDEIKQSNLETMTNSELIENIEKLNIEDRDKKNLKEILGECEDQRVLGKKQRRQEWRRRVGQEKQKLENKRVEEAGALATILEAEEEKAEEAMAKLAEESGKVTSERALEIENEKAAAERERMVIQFEEEMQRTQSETERSGADLKKKNRCSPSSKK